MSKKVDSKERTARLLKDHTIVTFEGVGLIFSLGRYGGFYVSHNHWQTRLCLGWLAITLTTFDADYLLYLAAMGAIALDRPVPKMISEQVYLLEHAKSIVAREKYLDQAMDDLLNKLNTTLTEIINQMPPDDRDIWAAKLKAVFEKP